MTSTDVAAVNRRTSGSTAALEWWRRHCDPKTGDAGTRAELRRCRSPVEAAGIAAALALARRVGALRPAIRPGDPAVDAALDLARVLAHVSQHADETLMRAAGWRTFAGDRKESDAGADRPRLSEVRFRRLLHTGAGEERVAAFTRLVALLGGTANVSQLAADFLNWDHPDRGSRVRSRWAFDYYAAGAAAPSRASTTDEEYAE